jgi:hypothetical protein
MEDPCLSISDYIHMLSQVMNDDIKSEELGRGNVLKFNNFLNRYRDDITFRAHHDDKHMPSLCRDIINKLVGEYAILSVNCSLMDLSEKQLPDYIMFHTTSENKVVIVRIVFAQKSFWLKCIIKVL